MARPLVYSAVPTAFAEDGTVDLASTARVFEHALDGGVDAIFVNGTTGEFPALSIEERRALLRTAIEVAGPERVVAHVGTAAPFHTGTLTADATGIGISKLSVLTPYYLPAGPEGVRRQLRAVTAQAGDAEVFLYLFPDRTGVELDPEEAARILDELNLAGIKISIPGTEYVRRIAECITGNRLVLSGNDGLLPEVVAAGGAGVVSGVSSSVPRPFVALAQALEADDLEREAELRQVVAGIVPVLGPSIASLKLSLFLQGIIASPACRMAIDTPSAEHAAQIAAAMDRVAEQNTTVG